MAKDINQLSIFKLGYTSGVKVNNSTSTNVRSGSSRYNLSSDGELSTNVRENSAANKFKPQLKQRTLTMNKPKVRAKIIAFSRASLGSLSMKFITVTFPAGLPDNLCMQALNTWLTKLRQLNEKFEYLWVAERQGNGTLHFHLFTKTFFNIRTINFNMAVTINNILFINKLHDIPFDYTKYNGIDVKVINKISQIVKYVTKYVTKVKELKFNRSWSCSRLVSRLFTHVALSHSDMSHCLQHSKKVFEHTAFEYHDGTIMSVEIYVPKDGAFMPCVSYIDAANEVVLMYESRT